MLCVVIFSVFMVLLPERGMLRFYLEPARRLQQYPDVSGIVTLKVDVLKTCRWAHLASPGWLLGDWRC